MDRQDGEFTGGRIRLPWGEVATRGPVVEGREWSWTTEPFGLNPYNLGDEVRVVLKASGWRDGPLFPRVDLVVTGMAMVRETGLVHRWSVRLAYDASNGASIGDDSLVVSVDDGEPRTGPVAGDSFATVASLRVNVGFDVTRKADAWDMASPGYVQVFHARAKAVLEDDLRRRGVMPEADDEGRLGPGERLLLLKALKADPGRIATLERRNAELLGALEALVGNIAPMMNAYKDEADDTGAASLPVGEGQYVTMYTFGDLRRAIALLPKDD